MEEPAFEVIEEFNDSFNLPRECQIFEAPYRTFPSRPKTFQWNQSQVPLRPRHYLDRTLAGYAALFNLERSMKTDDSDEDSDAASSPSQKNDRYRSAAVEDKQEECTKSSCARESADHQVLRTIENLFDKLSDVGDYSYDDGPIDFGTSYIWELHESCGVSQAEKDVLAHICESETGRRISSLIFNSNLRVISFLEGYRIIFHNQANIPVPTTSIRRLHTQEKEEFLTARLHSAFRKERFGYELRRFKRDWQAAGHQKVTPTGMRSFGFAHQWYHKAWNTENEQEDPQTGAEGLRVEDVFNSSLDVAPHLLSIIEEPRAYPHTRKLPICWKAAEPVIILVMSGAIFESLFSFLLIFHGFASPFLSSQLISPRNLCFANFEEHNLHILFLYLGLSVSSLWQEAKDLDNGTISSYTFPQTVQEQAVHPMEDTLATSVIAQPAYTHRTTGLIAYDADDAARGFRTSVIATDISDLTAIDERNSRAVTLGARRSPRGRLTGISMRS
ncbi:hypothetical protein B7463_g7989, partial [Scytalidium lignicola]